jgi:hypothetical protein
MESQGAESQRFRSLLGRRNVVPGCEDRVDYFMLRRKRNAYYAQEEDEEEFKSESSQTGQKNNSIKRLATSIAKVTSNDIRMSIAEDRKLRSTTYQKIKKSGTFKEKDEEQKINTNAEHLDFESLEKKKQFDEITNSVREKA